MQVRINRWQPRSNRYRTQTFELGVEESTNCFLDVLTSRSVQVSQEPGVEQVICRTQRIDRVLFNAQDNVIDVWMSPIVDRKYKRTGESSHEGLTTVSKKRLDSVTCECHHSPDSHYNRDSVSAGSGICLIPGCACKSYVKKTSSVMDELLSQ